MVVSEGKIIDASFIEVPKQCNSREKNKQIKDGETPKSFDENRNKKEQKDLDARWTKKNNVSYFGYKNYIKADAINKEKSRIRSRVEDIFGFMEGSKNGMNLYAIGIKRVEGIVGLMNLTYNMFRKIQIQAI